MVRNQIVRNDHHALSRIAIMKCFLINRFISGGILVLSLLLLNACAESKIESTTVGGPLPSTPPDRNVLMIVPHENYLDFMVQKLSIPDNINKTDLMIRVRLIDKDGAESIHNLSEEDIAGSFENNQRISFSLRGLDTRSPYTVSSIELVARDNTTAFILGEDEMPTVTTGFNRDNDTLADFLDACPTGIPGLPSFIQTAADGDYDKDGCKNKEDEDGDNDTIHDFNQDNTSLDKCRLGSLGWTSNSTNDRDGDGCRDRDEDMDDDGDQVLDEADQCNGPESQLGWTSNRSTDHDRDGCRDDNDEDDDDDNDGVDDRLDQCPKGQTGWRSNPNNDSDGDGCHNSEEGTGGGTTTPVITDGDKDNDTDGVVNRDDDCPNGQSSWTSDATTDHDRDGCRDGDGGITDEDTDEDNDGVVDAADNCPAGLISWTRDGSSDRDNDGCRDRDEDPDDDNDQVLDSADQCDGLGNQISWTSSTSTDHDHDGCQDSHTEDMDDDNDGVNDNDDRCARGLTGWTSTGTTDLDGDGCQDGQEGTGGGTTTPVITDDDKDNDTDGVVNRDDDCPNGQNSWTSNATTDHDRDGCQDSHSEDADDDNDGVDDAVDNCPTGLISWTRDGSSDRDNDGCRDRDEDPDDDNDQVLDSADQCRGPESQLDWISDASTDHDHDGCQDSHTEDMDDDNDGVNDNDDRCARGLTGWTSTGTTDLDGDGCQDGQEGTGGGTTTPVITDDDKDNDTDGVVNRDDDCPNGQSSWTSNATTDHDRDGCQDSHSEDADDDNDGVDDAVDNCPTGLISWTRDESSDRDNDGCRDRDEDPDDDNDQVLDGADQCRGPESQLDWTSDASTDHDHDGCRDRDEDTDDDNDKILDTFDDCSRGLTGWTSTVDTDRNGNGCQDGQEGGDDGTMIDTNQDLDENDNGLIDVNNRSELERIRRNPRGIGGDRQGCPPSGCEGFELNQDISLAGEEWRPISSLNAPFYGNGYSIVDITIDNEDMDDVGLFSSINGAQIYNLTLIFGSIKGGERVGSLAGQARNSHIENVTSRGDVVSGTTEVGGLIGRIAGDEDITRISKTTVEVNKVMGEDSDVGGLVGFVRPNEDLCQARANTDNPRTIYLEDVSAKTSSVSAGGERIGGLIGTALCTEVKNATSSFGQIQGDALVGGLIGLGYETSKIISAAASGDLVNATGYSTLSGESEVTYAGGFIGALSRSSAIISSYAKVIEVRGRGHSVGGFAGLMQEDSLINHSFAESDSVIGGGSYVGGLVGHIEDHGIIGFSYSNSANVRGRATRVGGLVGNIGSHSANNSLIYASYAITDNVNGTDALGGLVGFMADSDVFSSYAHTKRFNREPTSSPTNIGGLIGRSLQQDASNQNADNNLIVFSYAVSDFSNLASDDSAHLARLAHHINTRFLSSYSALNDGTTTAAASSKTSAELQNAGGAHFNAWQPPRSNEKPARGIWCDKNLDEQIDATEETPDNRIWEFGDDAQYPVLNCTPGGATRQHAQLGQ